MQRYIQNIITLSKDLDCDNAILHKAVFLNYIDKYYIIFTNHSSNKDSLDFIKIDNNLYKINGNKTIYPHIDLVIFEINDEFLIDTFVFFNIERNNYDLNDLTKNKTLFVKSIQKTYVNLDINILCLTKYKYTSDSNYDIMMILFNFNKSSINYLNKTEESLFGDSGTLIFNGDKILGIFSSNINGDFVIIPFAIISNIIKNNNIAKLFFELKNNFVNKINNKINYNFINKKKRYIKLYKNDILLELDDIPINEQGLIYDKNINLEIPLDLYFQMNKSNNKLNKFKIIRKGKLLDIITGNLHF